MLAPDTMLGPYRIVAPIGAGGMGEVYRAVDSRLGRDVAVKVLSPHLTHDAEATRRFEQEARAAGMLNHPNILTIYDIGSEEGQKYIVSELLEGESLRNRIRTGPIHARKAVDYGQQIARGLAAAHDRGIVHRDLKPENLFITRDGIVKILDFGLVKLMKPLFDESRGADENAPTLHGSPTEPGRVIGTIGYMAPEQIRGASGDHRSDIFAFGAILFEMLAGRPAFREESPIETLNAILRDEPPDLRDIGVAAPEALERIIRHCIEKSPDERFQSARDLAFQLGGMSGLTSRAIPAYRLSFFRLRALVVPLLAIAGALALAVAAYLAGTRSGRQPPPSYTRLSFRAGTILNARFAPDGQTVFYGARWGGRPMQMFSARSDSPESRDLGFGSSDIAAVSSTGQLAILLEPRFIGYLRQSGTLARVPIGGGAPRHILEDVEAAAWAPDGRDLAVVRNVDGKSRLEYPIGKVIYSTLGWISSPRFDAGGTRIAFVDHPFLNDDRGSIAVVPAGGGPHRLLTGEMESIEGLAWAAGGDEVFFAAHSSRQPGRAVNAVDLRGRVRTVVSSPGWLFLHDVSKDGRLLVTRQDMRGGIMASVRGEEDERDLSWLDYSVARDLSPDGKTVLFSESGEAGGALFGVYVRSIDGSPAVKLGDGTSESLSPDGRWVLSIQRNRKPAQIVMLPTGAGQPRQITNDQINHRIARWFPDGKRILFQGNEPGRPPRLWVQEIGGGKPRAIAPDNSSGGVVSPDGKRVLARAEDRKFYFFSVDGGTPALVTALHGGDVPLRFSGDGSSLYVGTFGRIPAVVSRIDLRTGQRVKVREAAPAERSGLINAGPVLVTPDGSTVVYSYARLLSDLYLVVPARRGNRFAI